MIAPVLHGGELALLDKLPHSDRRYSQNFSRVLGCDVVHLADTNRERCRSTGQSRFKRVRLAKPEASFTIEKAKVEAIKARLREHFQRRDRLRLVIGYRRKVLESLVRQGEEEAGKIAQENRHAGAQNERDSAETAAALAGKENSWAMMKQQHFRPGK